MRNDDSGLSPQAKYARKRREDPVFREKERQWRIAYYAVEANRARQKEACNRYRSNPDTVKKLRTRSRVENWDKQILNGARVAFKRRPELVLEIDAAWIREQFDRQKGKCFYTGLPMVPSAETRAPNRPSLDRKNPALGYTKENTVLCHMAINFMKNDMGYEEFLSYLRGVITANS